MKSPANRFGLDYRQEAVGLGPPIVPIIDSHTHINGDRAAVVYQEVAELYGIETVYSMTHLENVDSIRDILGDALRLIAVPQFNAEDKKAAFTTDWMRRIEGFAEKGCRICKFWCAPRSLDYELELDLPGVFQLDSPARTEAMHVARDCGMMFMAHIADPNTWFASKYTDSTVYGTKADHYRPLEDRLDEFANIPWLVAHMGGYPEDLEFLDGLLTRHANLALDTSATKWMVRELSKHSRADFLAFLTKWKGRILFGSDIVTYDTHLESPEDGTEGYLALASSVEDAFDLYASRYYALRTMLETNHEGESPIVDPDLHMVDPDAHDEFAAPLLRGHSLPEDILKSLYHDAASSILEAWRLHH